MGVKRKEDGSAVEADVAPAEDDGIELKPKMSLLNGVTVIVGSIIGSGIFISPTGVLENTGSVNASLVVWVLSGVFSMVGAYCYAELGCMISKSGADYAYIMETFGPFIAFMRLWVECMIVRPCSQAIVALTFSLYVLKPMYTDCDPPEESTRLLAACCIEYSIPEVRKNRVRGFLQWENPRGHNYRSTRSSGKINETFAHSLPPDVMRTSNVLLTFINCWDVKWATRVQDIFTYAKLLALMVIITTGVYQLYAGHTEHFTFVNTKTEVTSIALSFYSGLFAYNGWNYLNFVIEELKDPIRNLPRAIAISCILVTVVYVFTNIAFYTTLSPQEVLTSEAVAVTFAERLYGPMAWTIPVFVALSTFGAVNGILLTSSRLFYAGACEGQMPQILTMIQINRLTPTPAVICICLLSLIYLQISNIYALINYVGFATWLSIGVSVLCIPVLRFTQPNLERPIKVNMFFPVVYIAATLFVTIIPIIASPVETGYGCLMILTSIPVYGVFIFWKNKPMIFHKIVGCLTRYLQILLMVTTSKSPAKV